jgi:hypothetical protein
MGGIAKYFAGAYLYNKLISAEVVYEPVVSDIVDGGIAMYFRPDVATPTLDVGLDEYQHAITFRGSGHDKVTGEGSEVGSNFAEGVMHEPCVMKIDPMNAVIAYSDDAEDPAALQTAGIVQVLARSAFSGAIKSYGTVEIRWTYEFYGLGQAYGIGTVPSGQGVLYWLTYVSAVMAEVTWYFDNSALGAGQIKSNLTLYNGTVPDSASYVLSCQIVGAITPSMFCFEDGTTWTPAANSGGANIWCLLLAAVPGADFTNATIQGRFYRSLEGARDKNSTEKLYWGVAGAQTGSLAFKWVGEEQADAQ